MKLTTRILKNWTQIVQTDGRRFVFKSAWKGGLFTLESDPEQHNAWKRKANQNQINAESKQAIQFRKNIINLDGPLEKEDQKED